MLNLRYDSFGISSKAVLNLCSKTASLSHRPRKDLRNSGHDGWVSPETSAPNLAASTVLRLPASITG